MWVIVHTLTGMALGSLILNKSYTVIVTASLLFHVLLDLVPHWDYTHNPNDEYWGMADVLLSASVLLVAHTMIGLDWKIIVAGIVSAAPDLDVLNALLPTDRRWRIFPSHWTCFPHGVCKKVPGIAIQSLISLISILVLVFK